MLVNANRLRSEGVRRDTETVRVTPARGELLFSVRLHDPRPGRSVYKAALLVPDEYRYVYPVLDKARILKVTKEGVLVTGQEVIPTSRGIKNVKSVEFKQSWWCLFC